MKKLFTIVLVLNLTIGLCAQNFLINHLNYNVTSSTPPLTVEVGSNSYYGASSLIIPETVTNNGVTYSVTSIQDQGFAGSTNLTSVNIPITITIIGSGAFGNCNSLTSIDIPSSVIAIRDDALNSCSALTTINVDVNNPNYSSQNGFLFNKDKTIFLQYPMGKQNTTFTIPENVTSIGYAAFRSCVNLKSIIIPNGVTSIEPFVFDGCTGLTNIVLPENVMTIRDCAFRNCRNASSITISGSVTSIGQLVFESCLSLNSIYCNNPIPSNIVLQNNTFTNIVDKNKIILYVPVGSKTLYQAAPQWGTFTNIVEKEMTSVTTVISKNIKLYPNSTKDKFHVSGLTTQASLHILDLNGRLLFDKSIVNDENVSIGSLPHGLYLVKISIPEGMIERKIVKN